MCLLGCKSRLYPVSTEVMIHTGWGMGFKFEVGVTLLGVITDWSDAEIKGLQLL